MSNKRRRTKESSVSELRVVVADDHDVVRAGINAVLSATSDIRVVGEARNGEEACRLAAELKPDVVLMDLSMPVLDGVHATLRIRRECPDVAVLALTMHEDRARLERLMHAGASGYVLKRADSGELVRAIRSVAEGRLYVDPELAGALLRDGARSVATPVPLSDREEDVLRRTAWGAARTVFEPLSTRRR
jgi:DNA-binding NarL/FixJ family response regulator